MCTHLLVRQCSCCPVYSLIIVRGAVFFPFSRLHGPSGGVLFAETFIYLSNTSINRTDQVTPCLRAGPGVFLPCRLDCHLMPGSMNLPSLSVKHHHAWICWIPSLAMSPSIALYIIPTISSCPGCLLFLLATCCELLSCHISSLLSRCPRCNPQALPLLTLRSCPWYVW